MTSLELYAENTFGRSAKHAKAKQAEAKIVKKSAKSLGRHGK